MAKRTPGDATFREKCPFCRRIMDGVIALPPLGAHWRCEEHGVVTRKELDQPTRRLRKTKTLGDAFTLSCLDIIDEDPNLLLSGLPLFLEEEWPSILAMSESQRVKFWADRREVCRLELERRRGNPTRSVYWPWGTRDDDRKLSDVLPGSVVAAEWSVP